MSGNMLPIAGEHKKRICYFFDSDIGNYHYGPGHPMKPHRIRMTHALVMNYGLYKKMEIFRAKPATRKEMAQFHTDDYVDFLSKVTPDNMDEFLKEQAKFNLGDDCPVFDGLFEYCSISAGGSMEGAARLSRDKCDIAINWAGGLHHAKKAEANGFCYVNDIVLGILELLRYHKRVLYVDIDVHHGDGVEEAFYTTDRVMTCSFHKYGEFFPGTGELRDTGHGKGKYYAVNFPLRDGITDEAYKNIFEPVIMKIMETYQPSAIVLQCGGDSLSGDRLGSFNVSMRGHANCVHFIKSLGLPLLLLGGGGYTIRNVSRTWAYETGLAAGQELCPDIPMNEYYEYYGPTYRLDVPPSNMEDMNVPKYLEKTKIQIFENLRNTIPVPSVGLQAIPRMPHDEMDVDEDIDDPDERKPQRLLDGLIQRDDEFSDSEDEGEGGRRNVQSHKRTRRPSPKINGNGILSIHDSNKSRHSSLSSTATTSMFDATVTRHNQGSGKISIPSTHRQNLVVSSAQVAHEANGEKSTSSASSLPPTSSAPAAEAALVDIPMLSQADQIELEKLASEALTDSSAFESGSTQNREERWQPNQMEVDDSASPESTTTLQPEPLNPSLVSSSEVIQAEHALPSPNSNLNIPGQTPKQATTLAKRHCESGETSPTSQIASPNRDESFSNKIETSGTGAGEGKTVTQEFAPPNLLASASDPTPMEVDQIPSAEVTYSMHSNPERLVAPGNPTNQANDSVSSIHSLVSRSRETTLTKEHTQPETTSKYLNPPTTNPSASGLQSSSPSPLLLKPEQVQKNPTSPELLTDATSSRVEPSPIMSVSKKSQMMSGTPGDQSSISLTTSLQPMADPIALEGVTDEFVSEVAQAIAEGEAGTLPKTKNSSPTTNVIKHDPKVPKSTIEVMDPQLNSNSFHKTSSISSSSSSVILPTSPCTHTAQVEINDEIKDVERSKVKRSSISAHTPSSQTQDEIQVSSLNNSVTHSTRHLHPSLDPSITGPTTQAIRSSPSTSYHPTIESNISEDNHDINPHSH